MTDIDELLDKVCDHLAGRHVVLKWQDPPTQNAVGQVVRTDDDQFLVFVSPTLTGIDAKIKVMLHEVGHIRDRGGVWIPKTSKVQPSFSVARSDTKRQEWRKDPREKTAQSYGDVWWQYAVKNASKFMHVTGQDFYAKRLLMALLQWRE